MYVNKKFYDIICDNYLWKKRFMRKFNDCDVAFMMTNIYNGKVIGCSVIYRQYCRYSLLFFSISQKIYSIGKNLLGKQNWKKIAGVNMKSIPLLLFLREPIFLK